MTKQEVKDLGEGDQRLQWWAMILFAEVCELVRTGEHGGYDAKTIYPLVIAKTKEWDRIVQNRMIEVANKNQPILLNLEQRVAALEEWRKESEQ